MVSPGPARLRQPQAERTIEGARHGCTRSSACLDRSVAALVLCSSCGETRTDDPMAIKRFTLREEVTLVIPAMQRIVVRHEAIEGWTAASNMEYPIADRGR